MSGAQASAIPYLLAHLTDVRNDFGRRRRPNPRRLKGWARRASTRTVSVVQRLARPRSTRVSPGAGVS